MPDFFEGRVITKVFNGTNSDCPLVDVTATVKEAWKCAATHTYDHTLSGALTTP